MIYWQKLLRYMKQNPGTEDMLLYTTHKQTGEPRNTRSFPKHPDRQDLSWCLPNTGERSPCVNTPCHILPRLVYPPSWLKKLQSSTCQTFTCHWNEALPSWEKLPATMKERACFSPFSFLRTLEKMSLVLLKVWLYQNQCKHQDHPFFDPFNEGDVFKPLTVPVTHLCLTLLWKAVEVLSYIDWCTIQERFH